ncbi:IS1595 family transposase [Aliifodinibius salicampi]|uniref:IS1595 family transposase n=1 Tax=Fodinibius salicampi TaxID=1920655 RepID=A0ABT3PZD6_9BACT|nr:IS1595 family transposase [Fodinibius salicampi]MCW9713242.1 IS1595 family transposase [Fodinibius salicampi]
MDNKYVNRSKISEAKFRELVKLFSLDLTATQIAKLSGLNRNTVNRYIKGIRKRLAEYCEITGPISDRVKSLRQWPDGELRYLGIIEKEGIVCVRLMDANTKIGDKNDVRDLKSKEMDVIIDLKKDQKIWIEDRTRLQKNNRSKINRIDGFWGYAKSRLEKFKGIHSHTYFLHLKESEFRYNNNQDELYHLILKIIRKHPLF